MWYANLPWISSLLICKNQGICPATKSSQTQSSNRNEKDAQHSLLHCAPSLCHLEATSNTPLTFIVLLEWSLVRAIYELPQTYHVFGVYCIPHVVCAIWGASRLSQFTDKATLWCSGALLVVRHRNTFLARIRSRKIISD